MNNKEKLKLDAYAKESIPILKKYGYLDKKSKAIPIMFFLLGIIAMGAFVYLAATDAFKSDVEQNVNVEPEILVTNQYEFTPKTQNNYSFNPNFTIINNIVCP